MKKLLTLGMVAMLALAGAAYAYPTLYGPTGTGVQPNASVASGVNVAVDYYNTADVAPLLEDAIPIRVLFGAAENFEIGAAYLLQSDNNTWALNAKFATPLALAGANIAVGAQYFNQTDLDDTTLQLYAVGDIPVGETAKFSLGVNWTQNDSLDTDAFRFFAGFDATFAERMNFVADIQTENDALDLDMMYSVALRYAFTDTIAGQIGYSNADMFFPTTGISDGKLFVGVNFGFSTAVE